MLVFSIWLPVPAMIWAIQELDQTRMSVLACILVIVATAGLMVAIPSMAEERAKRHDLRFPRCAAEWASALSAVRASEPLGMTDPRLWPMILPGGELMRSTHTFVIVSRALRLSLSIVLFDRATTGDPSAPEARAVSACPGAESDGGAST